MAQQPLKLNIPLPSRFFKHPGDPRIRWQHWKAQLDIFFVLTNLTLATKLSDIAKNAYLSSLLGCEGSRVLMAHPGATEAATKAYDIFSKDVGKLFERPTNSV